jgi:hypothetical protein
VNRTFIILGILLILGGIDAAAQRIAAGEHKQPRHYIEDDSWWGYVSPGVTYVITPGGFKQPPGPGEGPGIVINPFSFQFTGAPLSDVTVKLDLPEAFTSLDFNGSLPLTDWTYALPPNDVRCQLCGETGYIQGDSVSVHIDSSGAQILNLGATLSVPSTAFPGEYNSSIVVSYLSAPSISMTDTTVERTLDVEIGYGISDIDAEMKNLSRNQTYSLIPGPVSNPISPLVNGRELGTIARVPCDGDPGSEILVSTVLPTSLFSDDEAYPPGLECRFTDSSVYVEETGEYINPLRGIKVRLGSDGHITLDIGVTITIPADAVPGSYTGQVIYSATYTGNKTIPRIPNPSEAEVLINARVLDEDIPEHFSLLQNYPNPFNSSTRISYELPKPSYVMLKVYDLLGREVLTLVDGFRYAGRQTESLSSEALSSGVYYYRIVSETFSETKKLVVTR